MGSVQKPDINDLTACVKYLEQNYKDEFPLSAPEDDLICRHYRPQLPFKWAPLSLAHDFAFELVGLVKGGADPGDLILGEIYICKRL